jgi:hypothetical protein
MTFGPGRPLPADGKASWVVTSPSSARVHLPLPGR